MNNARAREIGLRVCERDIWRRGSEQGGMRLSVLFMEIWRREREIVNERPSEEALAQSERARETEPERARLRRRDARR